MDPSPSTGPATAGVQVFVADAAWHRLVRNPAALVRRVALAALARRAALTATAGTGAPAGASVVLASDAEVKRLNGRHRGRNKPTNVLTFDAAGAGLPGEIVLACGTVRREARAAGKRPAHHLAHLVVHGVLHLQGHDHAEAGEARRMEMAEARILGRLRLPNPWRRA